MLFQSNKLKPHLKFKYIIKQNLTQTNAYQECPKCITACYEWVKRSAVLRSYLHLAVRCDFV